MFQLQVMKNSLPTDIEKIGKVSSLGQCFNPRVLVTANPPNQILRPMAKRQPTEFRILHCTYIMGLGETVSKGRGNSSGLLDCPRLETRDGGCHSRYDETAVLGLYPNSKTASIYARG